MAPKSKVLPCPGWSRDRDSEEGCGNGLGVILSLGRVLYAGVGSERQGPLARTRGRPQGLREAPLPQADSQLGGRCLNPGHSWIPRVPWESRAADARQSLPRERSLRAP